MTEFVTGIQNCIRQSENAICAELVEILHEMEKEVSAYDESQIQELCSSLDEILESDNLLYKVFLSTYLAYVLRKPEYLERVQQLILEGTFIKEVSNFLYQRINRYIFLQSELVTQQILANQWKILRMITASYKKTIEENYRKELKWIPESERTKGFVIVITGQFLSAKHAPTGVTLDRCRILRKALNKQVMLINLADVLTPVGAIPVWEGGFGNYIEQYQNMDHIDWKDVRFPFFQCDHNMPNVEVMNLLLEMIRNQKPEYLVDIGNCGIFAGLAANLVPVLTLGLGSNLVGSETQFCSLPGLNSAEAGEILDIMGVGDDYLIDSMFTFSIEEDNRRLSREEIGLSAEDHVVTVVGNRLADELSYDFWECLSKSGDERLKVLVIGRYEQERVQEITAKIPFLHEKIKLCGYADSLASYYRISDLYLNPVRSGGGTSAVMALAVGLPVLTTRYGDVYYNVGDDFAVGSLEEMALMVRKYFEDPVFYAGQSRAALERAAKLQDSEGEFTKLIRTFEERIRCL